MSDYFRLVIAKQLPTVRHLGRCLVAGAMLALGSAPLHAANIAVLSNSGETAVAANFAANIPGHTFTGINVGSVTPTLATLSAYDAVVLFENGTFSNAVNVGNRLAEYANTGRAVILGTFYDQDRSDAGFGGSWGMLETLDPNTTDGVATPYAYRNLNPASVVPHPLTSGVTSLFSNEYGGGNQAKAGSTVLATWTQLNANGQPDPVVAFRVTGSACVIHIGIFPDYPSYGTYGVNFGGDFYPLWRNAVNFGAVDKCGVSEPGREANLIIGDNVYGELITVTNPVKLEFLLRGCGAGSELFLLLHAPAMGVPVFSYRTMSGTWMPLPANLSQITPFSLAPPDGRYTLFTGNAPPGRYELYFACDFVVNGHLDFLVASGPLDYLLSGIYGMFDHLVVTVQ